MDIESLRELASSVKSDAAQLRRMVGLAAFGGEETGVRVKAPDLLVGDLEQSAAAILALIEENDRLRAVLKSARHHVLSEGDDSLLAVIDAALARRLHEGPGQ